MSASDSRKHSEHHFLGSVLSRHPTADYPESDALRHLALTNSRHIHSRKSLDVQHEYSDDAASVDIPIAPIPEPILPDLDLPHSDLDLTTTFESILSESITIAAAEPEMERVQKRASNVMKLAQENEKLKEELRAMTERLEAAERKQQELKQRERAQA